MNSTKNLILTILAIFSISVSFGQTQVQIKNSMYSMLDSYADGYLCPKGSKNDGYNSGLYTSRYPIFISDISQNDKIINVVGEINTECLSTSSRKKFKNSTSFLIKGSLISGEFLIKELLIILPGQEYTIQLFPTEKYKF